MNINYIIQQISINALPIMMAVVIHEVAHGWVADKLGDSTAKQMGRLTLNPFAHIDIFGTIILPILFIISGTNFLFGYAKPVPVNFRNLRRPKEDMVWVAGAGPASNIAIAVISAIVFRILYMLADISARSSIIGGLITPLGWVIIPLLKMLTISVNFNIFIAAINLIPIPPADGGRIAVGLLPPKQAYAYSKIEPIGMFLLIIILFYDPLGIFSRIIWPVVSKVVMWLLV